MSLYLLGNRTATISLRSEEDDELHDAITLLPDAQRVVIEMILAGYTQSEIANDLNLTQQAVSARYRGSLMHLRSALAVK